jgi:serine protease
VACVIYNNVEGDFAGTLGDGVSSTIPAITVSLANGATLMSMIGQSATVNSTVTKNVNAYAFYDGTSMATPHVSAVAALIWSAAPSKSNSQVRTALQATAEDLGTLGRDASFGYGLIRAKNALDYLRTH